MAALSALFPVRSTRLSSVDNDISKLETGRDGKRRKFDARKELWLRFRKVSVADPDQIFQVLLAAAVDLRCEISASTNRSLIRHAPVIDLTNDDFYSSFLFSTNVGLRSVIRFFRNSRQLLRQQDVFRHL